MSRELKIFGVGFGIFLKVTLSNCCRDFVEKIEQYWVSVSERQLNQDYTGSSREVATRAILRMFQIRHCSECVGLVQSW